MFFSRTLPNEAETTSTPVSPARPPPLITSSQNNILSSPLLPARKISRAEADANHLIPPQPKRCQPRVLHTGQHRTRFPSLLSLVQVSSAQCVHIITNKLARCRCTHLRFRRPAHHLLSSPSRMRFFSRATFYHPPIRRRQSYLPSSAMAWAKPG
jgi:hypothetical protein